MQKFDENISQGLFSVLFLLKGIFPSPVCHCRPSDTNRIYPKTPDIISALIYTRLQTSLFYFTVSWSIFCSFRTCPRGRKGTQRFKQSYGWEKGEKRLQAKEESFKSIAYLKGLNKYQCIECKFAGPAYWHLHPKIFLIQTLQ